MVCGPGLYTTLSPHIYKYSPYAQRVHIALEEAKAQYTSYTVDPMKKPDWYVSEVNPIGKVSVSPSIPLLASPRTGSRSHSHLPILPPDPGDNLRRTSRTARRALPTVRQALRVARHQRVPGGDIP